MGGSNSKAEDRIELGQVRIWVEKRMHERYGMGMGRITPALTACMASLVATQRAAIEVGGAICVAMSGERSAEGRRPGRIPQSRISPLVLPMLALVLGSDRASRPKRPHFPRQWAVVKSQTGPPQRPCRLPNFSRLPPSSPLWDLRLL